MKKIVKDTFGLLLVLGVVISAGAIVMGGIGVLSARKAASGADAIVRVSFSGYEDLFAEPYEYYAIEEDRSTEIAERLLPPGIRAEAASVDIGSDEDTDYWHVSVVGSDDELYAAADGRRDSTLGEGLYLTWSVWTEKSADPSGEDVDLFEKMSEYLNGRADGGPVSFMVMKHGGRYLVNDIHGGALYTVKDGVPVKAMDTPRYGSFSYYWFS